MLKSRPKGAVLPHQLSKFGNITSNFLLDFGSFRDLQRHRNGVIDMPMLTTFKGMHPWYIDQLPKELVAEAKDLVKKQVQEIVTIENEVDAQHYIAMGFMVYVTVTQALPAFVYRVELRTNKTVHPTLRSVTQKEAIAYKQKFPNHALHVNMDLDEWDMRRGNQTIMEKV
jgi:hypothetical protein